ncbi:ROK family protein [Knoellia sp. 3-2P3]|uniref:ROK family protein n=1 Tax=unclassified Knoellia TaxID=2618719 RepID=UPI0023D9EEFA|nr:ROK family protein [Knoellia sp. 3-2P3]MDF2094045.1 ROK family protein [Knoellia sp. 3-2P3]
MSVEEPAPVDIAGADVVAAVDVGGTRIKSALVDRSGTELVSATAPTPRDLGHPGALVVAVTGTVAALRAQATEKGLAARLGGCGVVVPGLVDDARGVAVFSANLGWRDLDVVSPLESALGIPVALGHDVRAGLVAEARWGAARGADHAMFVPLGTGIAGALMVDGRVLHAGGYAGELGHVVVEPGGPVCGCGAHGCLEAVSSASAIERAYAHRLGLAEQVTAKEIGALVAQGDPDAVAVWGHAVGALARAVVMAVTLTGVDLVLVGGGLAQSGDLLLEPLRRDVAGALTFQRPPAIARAALGDRAGCLGAACLAWDLT